MWSRGSFHQFTYNTGKYCGMHHIILYYGKDKWQSELCCNVTFLWPIDTIRLSSWLQSMNALPFCLTGYLPSLAFSFPSFLHLYPHHPHLMQFTQWTHSKHTRIQYASPSIMNHLSGTNGTTLHRLFYPTVVSLSLFSILCFSESWLFLDRICFSRISS